MNRVFVIVAMLFAFATVSGGAYGGVRMADMAALQQSQSCEEQAAPIALQFKPCGKKIKGVVMPCQAQLGLPTEPVEIAPLRTRAALAGVCPQTLPSHSETIWLRPPILS